MIDKLSSLFGTLSEPVVAASDGEIVYKNTTAKHLGAFAKSSLSELVPELALSCETDNFITETVLDGDNYMVAGTVLDDITVYTFRCTSNTQISHATDVIASVSMALREPLATMNLAAGQLLPIIEKQGDEKLCEYASMMHRGLFSIVRALNRLDALVFLVGGMSVGSERTMIDLVRLTSELIHTVSQMLDLDESQLLLFAEVEEAKIRCDKRLIERMLLCLIGNALIFTPQDTKIKITIKMPDDKVLIAVSDNGNGISEDARFDVWSRYGAWRELNDTRRGAGFGLSVVQAIARAHNGGALIESQEGRGTTVLVSLAATPDENTIPVFDAPESYSTVNDMREIFAELVNIIPKEKFTTKYLD